MNPIYHLGENPELDNMSHIMHPNEYRHEAYKYYFTKLYSLATNRFKWEFSNELFPERFIEIILSVRGAISFQKGYVWQSRTERNKGFLRRGRKSIGLQSIGYVFSSYVTTSARLDWFGQETKIRPIPFNNTVSGSQQEYVVANTIHADVLGDDIEKAVIGFNNHLREGLEWLPFICAKLATLESAIVHNINLLKQPLTIMVDDNTEFSADNLVEDYFEGYNVLKLYSYAGQSLADSLSVHQTGAENYLDTYNRQIEIELNKAYERLGFSTNIVDKKERVLQTEQLAQNAVSNLAYASMWESRQKLVDDINRVFPDANVKCEPILTLPEQQDIEETQTENGENENE